MKKVLVDLNIVLDFLNKRNFHEEAARLIDMCMQKELAGFICAHEIATLSYFSRNISDFKLSRVATYTPEQFFCL